MALAYLLSPTFEIVNTAGKPATGGYIEVYVSGTRNKYYCASDWNGTLHPFKIPLDSLGSNIVLAADSGAYDVFIYNRYGGLMMSRTGVKPGAGGGMGGGAITSSDGSITVTPTAEGVDLKVNGMDPSALRAGAESLTADGQYTFYELVRDGSEITVDNNGKIRLEDGWYHFDATVRVTWEGTSLVNSTTPVQLYTTLSSDVLEFDLSYEHNETVQLSGEVKITTGGTQFVLGITGLEQGMVAELVDFGIHTITGHGDAAGYEAGTGIVIEDHEISIDPEYVQETLSAGTGIVLDGTEISVDTSVIQSKLTAGTNVQINGNTISATDTTYSAGSGLNLSGTEFSVDTSVIQPKLTAGSNIVIQGNTISATAEPQLQANWAESDNQSVQYIQNKPQNLVQDASYVHTDNNFTTALKDKLDGIAAGAEVNVQASWTESNSSSDAYIQNKPVEKSLVAGSNITITSDNNSVTIAAAVPTVPVTDVEVNGTSVVNASGVAEITMPSIPVTDVEVDGTSVVNASGVAEITMPTIPVTDVEVGGSSVVNAQGVAEITMPTIPVTDVEVGGSSVVNAQGVAEITFPTIPVTDVEVGGASVVNAQGVAEITMPTIPVTDVEVDGSSVVNASGVAEIVMPTELVPSVGSGDNAKVLTAAYDSVSGTGSYSWEAPAGLLVAVYGTTTYAEVHAAVEAGKIVYCSVSGGAGPGAGEGRMAFLAYRKPGLNYEFQYYRSNSSSSGTDSIFVYKLKSDNTWVTTERTVKAGNISYPVTTVKVNGSSAMTGTVANITVPTVGTITL